MIAALFRNHGPAWLAAGLVLIASTGLFTLFSHAFGYDVAVRDMPIGWLVGGLVGASALFLLLVPRLIRVSSADAKAARPLLLFIILAGVVMRLLLFASEPVLEDDYQRYLWDGALAANGLNPYAISPKAAQAAARESSVGRLVDQSGLVIGRINHPGLRTLYPPVAQGAFALAHLLEPFSLRAWRAVILILDCVSLLLLLALLREAGRSPLWAALYWWHPLLLKEMFNSAHMEAVVIPFLLAGLLLAARGRLLFANLALSIAAGAKIWPALLLPLVWRKLAMRPRDLAVALACTAAIGLLCAWPLVSAGLDETSGLLAYAARWKTNSALYPLLESGASALLAASSISSLSPSLLARSLIALAICAVALFQARSAFSTLDDLITRALVITACVFLLSPAQFPWYYLWVLPLLALRPVPGLLLAGATLPLYYSAFHFLTHGSYTDFTRYVVWIIWLPVWGVLLRDIAGNGRQAAVRAQDRAAAGARREER